ncbi:hypothetical protein [Actinoplanes sp. M2I2]|uniref:hypothetical protein n=1 Tax=Actinoplanes sp. M2I2 TaxID=1734444 RepID=UPI002020C34D|nr:hypothetical protein [Actinoplanes sp. M2I2]
MTESRVRAAGSGNLLLAAGVGLLVGLAGFGLAYLIGPRTDTISTVPLALFVGFAVGAIWTWRMYRHGWRVFGG